MKYRLVFSRQVRRYYSKEALPLVQRLNRAFEILEREPYPVGSKMLKGQLAGMNRLRVGPVRIIYQVDEENGEIRIVKVGSRGDVY